MTDLVIGEPLVWQVIVKVDWELMAGDIGEPVEKLWSASALPLASVPDGPVTTQDCTPFALQEMDDVLPADVTRAGFALMVAFGARTWTDAYAVAGGLPAPEQVI
jgi:hypothetical protein